MIELKKSDTIPTVDQTLSILRAHNSMCPLYFDLDMILYRYSDLTLRVNKIQKQLKEQFGLQGGPTDVGKYIKSLAVKSELTGVFNQTATGGISLDKASISKAASVEGMPKEFITLLNLYSDYAASTKKQTTLASYAVYPISKKLSNQGHRMVEATPTWEPQVTGRIAMRNPAIQNMDRSLQDLHTAPEGSVFLHCDSSQVDPRCAAHIILQDPQINKLIEVQGDAYMAFYRYCMLPKSVIASGTLDFEYEEPTPEALEMRPALKAETNGVIYGKSAPTVSDPVVQEYYSRIGNHRNMLKWRDYVLGRIRSGNYTVSAYFGTQLNILDSDKLKNENPSYFEKECIKLATNYTIQGTAAELMRYSVLYAHNLLKKTKNSYINFYVHDAGYFIISEDELDLVAKPLQDCVSYKVDDALYIPSEYDYGAPLRIPGLERAPR